MKEMRVDDTVWVLPLSAGLLIVPALWLDLWWLLALGILMAVLPIMAWARTFYVQWHLGRDIVQTVKGHTNSAPPYRAQSLIPNVAQVNDALRALVDAARDIVELQIGTEMFPGTSEPRDGFVQYVDSQLGDALRRFDVAVELAQEESEEVRK